MKEEGAGESAWEDTDVWMQRMGSDHLSRAIRGGRKGAEYWGAAAAEAFLWAPCVVKAGGK